MCMAACLFLFKVLSLSVNSVIGLSTPTTGAACGYRATAAPTRSKPTSVNRIMGTILRQPTGWCQVLEHAKNQLLTQVGPRTPTAAPLPRYCMPIAAVSECDGAMSIKPVRLMGEGLTLYKDLSGTFGLVDRHCPHRRADLSYGFVEECGLRCNYHGWRFDEKGRCVEQPWEDVAAPEARFKDKIQVKAYRVEAKAGLLWAYLGPQPAPLVPDWEPFTWQNGFVQIVFADVPCNWLQCQENSIDPLHFEWMHMNWSVRLGLDGKAD